MEISFNNFKKNAYGETIKATGYFSNGSYDINYSSILSELIFNAGRWCESYSSDLFIDWYQIESELKSGKIQSHKRLFGFRKDGVDHASVIFYRCFDKFLEKEYIKIYELDINVVDDKITMELYEVHSY